MFENTYFWAIVWICIDFMGIIALACVGTNLFVEIKRFFAGVHGK